MVLLNCYCFCWGSGGGRNNNVCIASQALDAECCTVEPLTHPLPPRHEVKRLERGSVGGHEQILLLSNFFSLEPNTYDML